MTTRKIPKDAFEYYVSLGPSRSYQLTAEHYEVSKRAVTKHAGREGWADRLSKIEEKARAKSDDKLVESLGEMRDRHLMTVKAMHARALVALKQYPLNSGMEAMRGAELAIKLERLIVGEPSERTTVDVAAVTKREVERWLELPEGADGKDNQ